MTQSLSDRRHFTIEEYLEQEALSGEKHEYLDGAIVAMAGGSFRHTKIGSNLLFAAKSVLRAGGCDAFNSDLKVYVKALRSFFYPDVTIVCGDPEFDPTAKNKEAVTNPVALFEVLSPSTEKYDRTRKFNAYMQIESLREYVLVYADQPRIESFFRQEDGTWLFSFAEGVEAKLALRSLSAALPLAEVYSGLTFDPLPEPPDPREREANADRAAE